MGVESHFLHLRKNLSDSIAKAIENIPPGVLSHPSAFDLGNVDMAGITQGKNDFSFLREIIFQQKCHLTIIIDLVNKSLNNFSAKLAAISFF